MSTIYASDFLMTKRLELGFRPAEVAKMIGVTLDTYHLWESHGQLPEEYFKQISVALDVSIEELKAEAIAAHAYTALNIPKARTHDFVAKSLRALRL